MIQTVAPLITGLRLSRDEFIRRWEALPHLKSAELIDGVVFVRSAVSRSHGVMHARLAGWIALYDGYTPLVEGNNRPTVFMLDDVPQPDLVLRISAEYRGGSWVEDDFLHGAPELVVEICDTDDGPKLDLYRRAGVKEYITVDTMHGWLVWRVLIDGNYKHLTAGEEGVLRSPTFPGLWLNPEHVWLADSMPMIELLQQGIASPEHATFVESLRQNNT